MQLQVADQYALIKEFSTQEDLSFLADCRELISFFLERSDIRSLAIFFNVLNQCSVQQIKTFFSQLAAVPRVDSFCVVLSEFNHWSTEKLSAFFVGLKEARITIFRLHYSNLNAWTPLQITAFFEAFAAAQIVSLELYMSNIKSWDDGQISAFCQALTATSVNLLHVISDHLNDWTPTQMTTFMQGLVATPVVSLGLMTTGVQAWQQELLIAFCNGLKNTQITSLDLSENFLSEDHIKLLLQGLKNTKITTLNVALNFLGWDLNTQQTDFFDYLVNTNITTLNLSRSLFECWRVEFTTWVAQRLQATPVEHLILDDFLNVPQKRLLQQGLRKHYATAFLHATLPQKKACSVYQSFFNHPLGQEAADHLTSFILEYTSALKKITFLKPTKNDPHFTFAPVKRLEHALFKLGDRTSPLYKAGYQVYREAQQLMLRPEFMERLNNSLQYAAEVIELCIADEEEDEFAQKERCQKLKQAIIQLEQDASQHQGHPSQWKKFAGALLVIVVTALVVLTGLLAPTLVGSVMLGLWPPVVAAGITLFAQGFGKGFSAAESKLAKQATRTFS